jgi:hypothetical protein
VFIIVALTSDAMHKQDPSAWTWINLFQPVAILLDGHYPVGRFFRKVAVTLSYLNQCHHVDPCACTNVLNVQSVEYTELEATNARNLEELETTRTLLAGSHDEAIQLKDNLADLRREDAYWRNNGRASGPDYWDKTPPQSPRQQGSPSARSLKADQDNLLLRNDVANLRDELRVQEKSFQNRMKTLQAQLTYAQKDGNSIEAKEDLNNLKAKERLQQDIRTLTSNLMHLKQELSYERGNHSLKCKSEATCSTRIRELEGEKARLLQQHADNDTMVQQAAIEFGRSPEEAQHITLKEYFQEITEAVVRRLGTDKFINAGDHPIHSRIANGMEQHRIMEITEYKNRLEVEVQRLGGDVKAMRLGLDPRRPPPLRELTYDNNANKVYEIYERLFSHISHLTNIIHLGGESAKLEEHGTLFWAPENPRSDFFNALLQKIQDWTDPRVALKVGNPRYEDNEILLQSLLSEISRLVNRGMTLKNSIEHNATGNGPFYNNEVDTPLKNALFSVLDDLRPLAKRDADIKDAYLTARTERRFEIWRAMQQAISALTDAIGTFNCIAPPWTNDPQQPKPTFARRKNFEALATNLMKFEINTLEHRIDSLLSYMNIKKLPGTLHGAPRLQGPPGYQADFDALKAAVTFGLLVKNHWTDKGITDPAAIKPLRLPLDHPPLIHGVLRRTGDVMVPKKNPFPWKLARDGKLVPADGPEMVKWAIDPADNKNDKSVVKWRGSENERVWHNETYDRVKQLSHHIEKSGNPFTFRPILPTLWPRRGTLSWMTSS